MAVNLLPPKYQPKPLVVWKRMQKILVVSLLMFLTGFLGANYYFYRAGLVEKMDNLQANIDNLNPVFLKVEEYEKTLETVKQIEQMADKIGKAKQIWSDILADIAGSLPENIWFFKISKIEDWVVVEGEARDFTAVGELAVNLRKLSWFKQVDIDFAERTKKEITGDRQNSIIVTENVKFKITAVLKENIRLFSPPEGGGAK